MEVFQVTDWLYCLRTPIVQSYAIVRDRGVTLVDASTAGQETNILELVAEAAGSSTVNLPVRDIFITHGHDDHCGSAAALVNLTGAKLLGPELEADVIEGLAVPAPPTLLDWEVPLAAAVEGKVPPAPPATLDARLNPGDDVDWQLAVELIAAPGHTSGQIALWFPDDRVLIAADAMASHEGRPMPGVFNVNPEQAVSTYRSLTALDPDIVCFGHGDPIVGGAGERLRAADSQ